jgi:peptidoglycan/LPS O-acetylase OafA/YrhL
MFALVLRHVGRPCRHEANFFGLGWRGVNLCFVISGYLLGDIHIDNRDPPRVFRILYARCLSHLPLYFACFALFLSLRELYELARWALR